MIDYSFPLPLSISLELNSVMSKIYLAQCFISEVVCGRKLFHMLLIILHIIKGFSNQLKAFQRFIFLWKLKLSLV